MTKIIDYITAIWYDELTEFNKDDFDKLEDYTKNGNKREEK